MAVRIPALRALLIVVVLASGCADDFGGKRDADAGPADGARDGQTDHTLDLTPGESRPDLGTDGPAPDGPPPAKHLAIHFKKPSGWTVARAHTFDSWPDNLSSTWPGVQMTAESNGWYGLTLSGQRSAGIVFTDGAGNQTVDLWRAREGWFTPTATIRGRVVGRWTDANPDVRPTVRVSPAGGSIYAAEVIVTLGVDGSGIKQARYSTDGSDPSQGGTSFSDGDKIALGQGLAAAASLTLRVFAEGPGGSHSQSYTFTRKTGRAVESWNPQNAPTSVNKVGRWHYLDNFSGAAHNLLSRQVRVLLPADYDKNPSERYPVLYFHDGQNLQENGADGQEWLVDERHDELVAEGLITPAIIVGVFNTSDRDREYAGCNNDEDKKKRYGEWMVHALKPYIDQHYRTKPQAEHTLTMGSSYGGLVSHYLAWTFPDTYGGAGCLSTQFAFCTGPAVLSELSSYSGPKKATRYWIDAGSAEGGIAASGRSDYIERNRLFAQSLLRAGWKEGDDLVFLEIIGGDHSVPAWAKRVKNTIYFLLRHRAPLIASADMHSFKSSIGVGQITEASLNLRFENNFRVTKLFDTSMSISSSNASIATVDPASGTVTGKAPGAVSIDASYQSYAVSLPISVQ
ncbi:MAG: starch-binding protein [Myxococcales bacterium]|nr:starch-binding protein [Myxococcales bacterium]